MANDFVRFTTGSENNVSQEVKEKGKVLFAITEDNKGYIYFDKDNNTRIKMSEHALTAEKDVANNSITSYIRGVSLNKNTGVWTFNRGAGTITIDNSNYPTQLLSRPIQLNGVDDVTLQTLFSSSRANRLAFLPASQIIIEQTVDGGATWTDAGISDSIKEKLFSEQRPSVNIPKINNIKNINCGLRITFTAMKYNVPEGTPETQKYNYWNSQYVISAERYCQLKELYFWLSSNSDGIQIKAERATGANPNNWSVIFENTNWAATGWSGNDYIRFSQSTFGGGTTQTGNYWNYRLTFFTRNNTGGTTLSTSSTTSGQAIQEIRGYGTTWWTRPNNYMAEDHLYVFDEYKNATFPANLTAVNFIGTLTGNAETATKAEKDLAGNVITTNYIKHGSIEVSDTNHNMTYKNGIGGDTKIVSLPFVKLSGDTMTGNLTINHSNTDASTVLVKNNNGQVQLHVATNRGLYDTTGSSWIIYRQKADNTTYNTYIVAGAKEWKLDTTGKLTTPDGATATANMIGTASRAVGDSAGNEITSTYIKNITFSGNDTTDADGTTIITAGSKGFYTITKGSNASTKIALPIASSNVAGIVTNTAQTWAGNKTFTGQATFSATNGFTYSGIGTASDAVARPVWFSYNGVTGRPVYDNDFKYNPSSNTLTVANVDGLAAKATADAAGNTITTNYIKHGSISVSDTNHNMTYTNGANGDTKTVSLPFVKLSGDTMTGNLTTSGDMTAVNFIGHLTGNADSASTLTHKTVDSTTLHNTAGSFAFSGNGVPWSGDDYVGLQIGDSADKFQITGSGKSILFRQNDNGGTNTTWGDWHILGWTTRNTQVGSATQPVYMKNDGEISPCTYSLKATVNNATKFGVAYYSETTSITSTAAGAANTALMGKGSSAAPAFVSVTPTLTLTGGTTAGPKIKINVLGVDGSEITLPTASSTASGIVTTDSQTFLGTKTFTNPIVINAAGDSSYSTFNAASIVTSGGVSVAKNLSAKSIRIDNNKTDEGVSLQYNETLDTLNFVFV